MLISLPPQYTTLDHNRGKLNEACPWPGVLRPLAVLEIGPCGEIFDSGRLDALLGSW